MHLHLVQANCFRVNFSGPFLLGFISMCANEELQRGPVTPLLQVLTLGFVKDKYAGKCDKLCHDLFPGLSDQDTKYEGNS